MLVVQVFYEEKVFKPRAGRDHLPAVHAIRNHQPAVFLGGEMPELEIVRRCGHIYSDAEILRSTTIENYLETKVFSLHNANCERRQREETLLAKFFFHLVPGCELSVCK